MPPADLTFGPCCRPRRPSVACSNLAISCVYEFDRLPRGSRGGVPPGSGKNLGGFRPAGISPLAIRLSASIQATSNIGSRRLRKWSPRRMGPRSTSSPMFMVPWSKPASTALRRSKLRKPAKVIENTQRDLNIALMNELSAIFHKLGIDTGDVLAAAATKWNFLNYQPGLVGGHCIGVDPYYLTFRAEKAGYHPEIILAGRRINDSMGDRVARECMRALLQRGRVNPTVTILGMTFKENVPDIRNSKVIDIARELQRVGVGVQVNDPIALAEETAYEYEIKLTPLESLQPADAVILAVAHKDYVAGGWPLVAKLLKGGQGIVLDVKAKLDRANKPEGIDLWRL